jgi:hypothetical protein
LQNLEGFLFQPHSHAMFAYVASLEVDLKSPKTNYGCCEFTVFHFSFRATSSASGLDLLFFQPVKP